MPLVRVQVKSEFGLGKSELYRDANCEDPKAVLDGVAVAGLVGILRQLGDLAEFAGDVFHGLQEQVMTTASRSQKVMGRVKKIEAALPSLEKAILAQTSHIHFAYTAGSEWHPRIRTEQNQFIYHDLPRFIMDAYEECRDPPQLHLLDKFDTGGPGSCLKRYSDPTFFKRTSATSGKMSMEKVRSGKKAHKTKRKRSLVRNEEVVLGASVSNLNNSLQFTSLANQGTSVSQIASTADMMTKSDAGDCSNSFDSGTGSGYIDHVFNLGSSMQAKEQEFRESPKSSLMQFNDTVDSVFPDEKSGIIDDKFQHVLEEQMATISSHVTWDEKAEIVVPTSQPGVREKAEIVVPTSQPGVREKTEIVVPRSQPGVREKAETEVPRSQPGFREKAETEVPRSQLGVREKAETEEPGVQQDGIEKTEIVEPRSQPRVREKAETEELGGQPDGIEKAEIVEPRSRQSESDEEFKVLVSECTLDPHEREDFYLIKDEKMDVLTENGHSLESIYNVNGFDEIESETDNYMDALNTIESESETDLDCQTKREVEPCPSIVNGEAADPMHDLLESSLDPSISILNPSNEPHISSDKGLISDLPDLVDGYHDQRLENVNKVSSPDCSLVTDLHGKESSTLESAISNPFHPDSTFSLQNPSEVKLSNRMHESEKASNFSTSHLDSLWTNGGLLGLQPSKPPSWAVSNAASKDLTKGEKRGPSDHGFMVNGNAQERKMDILQEDAVINKLDSTSNNPSLHHDDRKDDTSGNVLRTYSPSEESSRALYVKNESCSINHTSNGSSHAHTNDIVRTSLMMAGTASPVVPNVNCTYTQTSVEKDNNSNQISGLSHRFLVNGFHRKLTLTHDERTELATSMNTGVPENRSFHQNNVYQTMSESTFKEQFSCDSPIDSLPPSPPLDHMKISFHPVSGFEISKLKLKFPNGSEDHGSMKDIFPSFQLAPEESISVHEIGSESDDDTFCRSSPCRSDDCLSDHSKSNSDLWESDDTPPEIQGHNLYDLCQISHMESLSTSFELEGITRNGISMDGESRYLNTRNDLEKSLSIPVLDLPSFDIVNPVINGRFDDSNAMNLLKLQCSDNPAPAPPPLPPAQWRVLKTSLGVPENEKHLSAHPKLMESIVSQHQIPHESIASKPNCKKEEQVMMDEQKEINHIGKEKVMVDREDFLQQIREKSFNLRPTVTEKPTTTAGPTTHVKVTAILEKANAIRQAVGSDNGEDDDSWSDA